VRVRVVGPLFFDRMETSLAELTSEIRRRADDLGYELVDIRKRGTRNRVVLQIRIDRVDAVPGHGITIEECAAVSRSLEPWLDDTQLLGPRYVLEVSSPGIERPIRWPEHWARFTGQDVHVRLPDVGRVRATIVRVLSAEGHVVLRLAGSDADVTIAMDEVRDATLAVDWSSLDWSAAEQKR
jgi:ribosome maturation factor RimP